MLPERVSPHEIAMYSSERDSGLSPIAQLPTIDLGRLYERDEEEAAKLLKAAKNDGVFYLDLHHPSCVTLLEKATSIFALSEEIFCLDEEEKMLFDIDKLSILKMNG